MERVKYQPEQDVRPDNVTEWRVVDENNKGTTYVTNYGGSPLITKCGKHTMRCQRICISPAMLANHIHRGYKRFTSTASWISDKLVHRVIYQAFHPDEDMTGKQIDHIDGNRYNNRVDNLRACTNLENAHFAAQIRRGEVIVTNLQKSLFYVN